MQLFNECLDLRKQITTLTEQLYEIQSVLSSPKNQVITGMPKGKGGESSGFDRLIDRKDLLQEKKEKAENLLCSKWREANKVLIKAGANATDRELMCYRFYGGFPWKQCTKIMQRKYGSTWNENKVFRVYRCTMDAVQRAIYDIA